MLTKLIGKWLDLYDIEAKPYHYEYFQKYFNGFSIRNKVLLNICALVLYISPALLQGKLRSAASLSNDEYIDLISKFQFSNIVPIRLIPFAVQYPFISLIDLKPEIQKNTKVDQHPLKPYIKKEIPSSEEKYDFVIIGSGAGGSPVAFELVKAGYTVCMIEKGKLVDDRTDLSMFARDFYVKNSLDVALSLKGVTLISSGSSIGGTTPINLGTSLIPNDEFIEKLEQLTNSDKGQLLNYFSDLNEYLTVRESEDFELNKSGRTMYKWAEENGYDPFRLAHNYNNPPDEKIDHSYPNTINRSMDRSYLVDSMKSGMKLYSESEVDVIKEMDDEVFIKFKRGGGHYSITSKKVIISAGALNTPNLVKKNEIGSKWGEAGDNFKIHPSTSLFAFSEIFGGRDTGIPQDIGFYDKKYGDILYEGISLPKQIKLLTQMGSTTDFAWWYKNADKVLSLGFLMKENTLGKVRNYLGENIYFYDLEDIDIEKIEHGIQILAKALLEHGAEKVLLPIADRNNTFEDQKSLDQLKPGFVTSKNINTAGFHPSGTVALGRLVDEDFKIVGSDNVYICDASLLPDSPGVNPQLTIMALSLCLGKRLSKKP